MSIALAHFLKAAKNKSYALKKFIAAAKANDVTKSTGWSARLEAAKLILNEGQGKARSKVMIFEWLSEMIGYNGKNLFIPFILLGKLLLCDLHNSSFCLLFLTRSFLLGKCHENEICDGCTKSSATSFYENGLQCKTSDVPLEIYARMRLVEIYYNANTYRQLTEQLKLVEPLIESHNDVSDKKSKIAELYYYKGKHTLDISVSVWILIFL